MCGLSAIVLAWLLCPAAGYASALLIDDFEAGNTSAWSEDEAGSAAPDVEDAVADKSFSATEVGVERRYDATPFATSAATPIPAPEETWEKFIPAGVGGIPGRYTVTLFAVPAASAAPDLVSSVGGQLGFVYRHVLNGFEAELTESQAIELSQDPLVKQVIQDAAIAEATSSILPNCYADGPTFNDDDFPDLPGPGAVEQQGLICTDPNPGGNCEDNWGLDRIDQRELPIDHEFSFRHLGGNVRVFVVDRGVAGTNREFEDSFHISRVLLGRDTTCFPYPLCSAGGNTPCGNQIGDGHGTHVAAIIGGRTFGLAKDVEIEPLKSICNPFVQPHAQRAFEYIAENHPTNADTAIVNLSGLNGTCLADPACATYNNVRTAMLSVAARDNIMIVQSAGNESSFADPENPVLVNACDWTLGDESRYSNPDQKEWVSRILIAGGSKLIDAGTPAEREGLLSTQAGEYPTTFGSNVGNCVDIFAPAAYISSAYFDVFNPEPETQVYSVCELSGTSMAAPHVVGVAAMILSDHPTMPSRELKWRILGWGVNNALEDDPDDPNYIGAGSPNLLLHWHEGSLLADGFESRDLRLWDQVFQ